MAINRALMNRQMYNMGGPSLQAGAPDITLTGDMRPTYSAMRKQRMAFGGIAGLDGRKKYGIGSWFQENIMDPIKENPITSAVIGGGLVNQFGLPDVVTEYLNMGSDVGQNFLGNLIGRDLVLGDSGMFETGSDLPNLVDIPNIFGTGTDNENNQIDYQKLLSNFVPNQYGTSPNYGNIFGLGLQENQQQRDARLRKEKFIDFAQASAAGLAAKQYVEGQPRDTIPADTTGLDIPAITAAAQGSDAQAKEAGLRFTPQQETRLNPVAAAEGGRIGYDIGGDVDPMTPDELPYARDVMPMENRMPLEKVIESYMKSEEGKQELMDKVNQGMSMPEIIDQMKQELMMAQNMPQGNMPMQQPNRMMAAEGGRIGYDMGGDVMMASHEGNTQLLEQLYEDFIDMGFSPKDAAKKAQEAFDDMTMKQKPNRVMAQEGGLMNLGGMEKDYREEGGFVPIGGKEKADDVPARLSKNEFVFTADAVRNAGGGDIDQGAQVMEKLMRNLESGGQVSEESQGLEGAREMFETSQRLEKRII